MRGSSPEDKSTRVPTFVSSFALVAQVHCSTLVTLKWQADVQRLRLQQATSTYGCSPVLIATSREGEMTVFAAIAPALCSTTVSKAQRRRRVRFVLWLRFSNY